MQTSQTEDMSQFITVFKETHLPLSRQNEKKKQMLLFKRSYTAASSLTSSDHDPTKNLSLNNFDGIGGIPALLQHERDVILWNQTQAYPGSGKSSASVGNPVQ